MSVGATLRQAREAKGLSLEDIKNSTQIMTRQLQEMEHDDFSSFAAPIYAKGFIRLFARAVGIDPEPLVKEFSTQPMKPASGGPAPRPVPAAPAPAPAPAPAAAAPADPAGADEDPGAAEDSGDLFSLAANPRRAVPLPGASGDAKAPEEEPAPAKPAAKVVASTPLAFELRQTRSPQPEKRVAALEPGVPAPEPLPSPRVEMRPGERPDFVPPPAAKKLPEPESAAWRGSPYAGTGKPVAPDPLPLSGPAFRFPEPRPLPRPEPAAAAAPAPAPAPAPAAKPAPVPKPAPAPVAAAPSPLQPRQRKTFGAAPAEDDFVAAAPAPARAPAAADDDEEIVVAKAPRRRREPRPDAPNAAALFLSNLGASLRRAFPPRRAAIAAGVAAALAILVAGGIWLASGSRGDGAPAPAGSAAEVAAAGPARPSASAQAEPAEPPEPIVAVFPPPFSWAK